MPLDIDTIVESVAQDRTLRRRPRGDADVRASAPSCCATVQERVFYHLEAPVDAGVPAGTRPTRTPTNGRYFPGPDRLGRARCGRGARDVQVTVVRRVRLPDVGEGVAEAELVEWLVAVGDTVTTGVGAGRGADRQGDGRDLVSPVAGVVAFLNGEPGDRIAVGTEIVGIELDGADAGQTAARSAPAPASATEQPKREQAPAREQAPQARAAPRRERSTSGPSGGARPIASPAIRRRAVERGIDLRLVAGTGQQGRITDDDLDRFAAGPSAGAPAATATPTAAAASARPAAPDAPGASSTQLRGIRRQIAERMSLTWSSIPHITYVDEVDATELTELRKGTYWRNGAFLTRMSSPRFAVLASFS